MYTSGRALTIPLCTLVIVRRGQPFLENVMALSALP